MLSYFLENRAEIGRLAAQHVALSATALSLALLVGFPLGLALTRRRSWAPWVLGATSAIQTVPSIALLGLLLLLPGVGGIGARPAITALFLYSLMIVVESVYSGVVCVDPTLVDAGRGLGMTRRQLLLLVELPLARPALISGLRMSAVLCLATTTAASYIGAGGLGDLIFRGVGRGNPLMVAWGALPVTAMAMGVHIGLVHLERRLARETK